MYPKDLDEMDEEQLVAELNRRAKLRAKGRCDYCGQHYSAPSCKLPERHTPRRERKTR